MWSLVIHKSQVSSYWHFKSQKANAGNTKLIPVAPDDTGASKKKIGNISKSETFIYSRFITCKVKHFKRFFVLILMIRAYSS